LAGKAYATLINKDGAYRDVAYKKVVELSNDRSVLLRASKYFENNNDELYMKAMIRYLDLEDLDKLGEYEEFINNLKQL